MKRVTYRAFHASNILVTATGLGLAWLKYVCRSDDPFAVVNHPWQPHSLHLHILTAPLLVFFIGIFWQTHGMARWRRRIREGRRTGIALLLLTVPMIASGYLIQIAVSDGWRRAWVAVHLLTCVVWIVASIGHLISHRTRTARNRRLAEGSASRSRAVDAASPPRSSYN